MRTDRESQTQRRLAEQLRALAQNKHFEKQSRENRRAQLQDQKKARLIIAAFAKKARAFSARGETYALMENLSGDSNVAKLVIKWLDAQGFKHSLDRNIEYTTVSW